MALQNFQKEMKEKDVKMGWLSMDRDNSSSDSVKNEVLEISELLPNQ